MKRWMLVVLVAALAAGLVPVAIAGTGGSDGDRSQFMVEGVVQYITAGDGCNYVVITPTTGTKDVKDLVRAGVDRVGHAARRTSPSSSASRRPARWSSRWRTSGPATSSWPAASSTAAARRPSTSPSASSSCPTPTDAGRSPGGAAAGAHRARRRPSGVKTLSDVSARPPKAEDAPPRPLRRPAPLRYENGRARQSRSRGAAGLGRRGSSLVTRHPRALGEPRRSRRRDHTWGETQGVVLARGATITATAASCGRGALCPGTSCLRPSIVRRPGVAGPPGGGPRATEVEEVG